MQLQAQLLNMSHFTLDSAAQLVIRRQSVGKWWLDPVLLLEQYTDSA